MCKYNKVSVVLSKKMNSSIYLRYVFTKIYTEINNNIANK